MAKNTQSTNNSQSTPARRNLFDELNAAESSPNLTRAEQQRLAKIRNDAFNSGAMLLLVAITSILPLAQGAIAAPGIPGCRVTQGVGLNGNPPVCPKSNWKPDPERGSAESTLSSGYRS
jgi:hypothetical protein